MGRRGDLRGPSFIVYVCLLRAHSGGESFEGQFPDLDRLRFSLGRSLAASHFSNIGQGDPSGFPSSNLHDGGRSSHRVHLLCHTKP